MISKLSIIPTITCYLLGRRGRRSSECWIFLLSFALISVTFADFPAHFNTADESIIAEINRIYTQLDYRKALDEAEQLKAKSGDVLVPAENQFIPLKYALSTGRNRPLTADELAIYQSRYESVAASLLKQAVSQMDPYSRDVQLWDVYQTYPCTKQGLTSLIYLSEYFYQSRRFTDSQRILELISSSEYYDKNILPSEQLDARIILCRVGQSASLTGQELEEAKVQIKKSIEEFKQKYSNRTGMMGGKKVVLSEFLRQNLERQQPISADKTITVTDNHKVDSAGLWRLPCDDKEKPELIYEDESPESVKEQYEGEWTNNVCVESGLVFAVIGTPNAYLNSNLRVPLELSNRLVCVDTRQANVIAWEKNPTSPSCRWLAPLCYQNERLYVTEVKTTSNSYELSLVCLDASSGMELSRTWLLSTTQKMSVEYQTNNPFTISIVCSADEKSVVFEINRTTNKIVRLTF